MIADHICSRGDRRLLRVGIPIEYNVEELDPIVRQVWLQTLTHLRNQGHLVQEISLPLTRSALSAYYVLATAEASSNLSKYDGVRFGNKSSKHRESGDSLYSATRGDGLGEEVRRRILLGSYSLSAAAKDNYFIKAQKVRRLVQQDFDRAFALTNPLLENMGKDNGKNGVDIIISPTAQSLPPRLGSISSSALVNTYTDDTLTVPPSLAGLPAISVPISRNDESNDPMRPSTVGLQVIAQYGDDDLLFDVARILETL